MKHADTGIFLLLLIASSATAQVPRFEENKGQWDACAKYLLRSGNVNLWITDSGMVYDLCRVRHSDTTMSFPRTRESRSLTPLRKNYGMGLDSRVRGNDKLVHANGLDTLTRIGHVVRMSFLHTTHPQTVASTQESGTTNYFIGNDPSKWVTGVRSFGNVTLQHLYDGIDAVFSLDRGAPRYDLIVQPGYDPSTIGMRIEGADSLVSNDGNELIIKTSMGNIEERGLFAYQEVNGVRQQVGCTFQIVAGNCVSFKTGPFDRTRPLVIDPLIFSTYLGGGDAGSAIAIDRAGNSYVTGWTGARDFPVSAGAYQKSINSSHVNAFIAKMNANGTALVYATYLGGSGSSSSGQYWWEGDVGESIAIDSSGNAYVAGTTGSKDFPTMPGAFQRFSKSTNPGSYINAFVTKLNATGTALLYSTYLGGSDGYWDGEGESASGIVVDSVGEAFVIGTSSSSDFPTTKGAYQTKNPNFSYNIESDGRSAFIAKLNARGNGLIYSTYLGGSKTSPKYLAGTAVSIGTAIAIDRAGSAFVAGRTAAIDFPVTGGAFQSSNLSSTADNAFVTKFDATGSALLYSTYLGDTDAGPVIAGIAIDTSGEAFVTGTVYTTVFPVTPGAFQTTNRGKGDSYQGPTNAFVTKLNAAGSGLMYSTYLGGTAKDGANGIAIDSAGNAYVAGAAWSLDFPALPGAIQTQNHGAPNAFVSELNASGSALLYSTYLGGSGSDQANGIAIDSRRAVYVAGEALSENFPVTAGVFQASNPDSDGSCFIAKLSPLTLYLVADSLHDLGPGSLCRTVDTEIVLTNAGTDTLLIKHIELTGHGYAMATQQDSVLLLPGASKTVIVEYHPTLTGSDTAILTVATNAANDSMMTIQFVAKTGVIPLLHVMSALTRTSVAASDTTTLLLSPDIDVTNLGLNSIEFTIRWNSDLLTTVSIQSALPGVTMSTTPQTTFDMTSLQLTLTGANLTLTPSQPIATILFKAAVADSASTQIRLSDPILNDKDDSSYRACTLAANGSSTTFSLQPACMNPLIMAALNHGLMLSIKSIYPNPASTSVRCEFQSAEGLANIEVFDQLGRNRMVVSAPSPNEFSFDTRTLPGGVYTIVLKSEGQVARGQFVVTR